MSAWHRTARERWLGGASFVPVSRTRAQRSSTSGGWEFRNLAIWLASVYTYGAVGAGLLVYASGRQGVPRYLVGGLGVVGVGWPG